MYARQNNKNKNKNKNFAGQVITRERYEVEQMKAIRKGAIDAARHAAFASADTHTSGLEYAPLG